MAESSVRVAVRVRPMAAKELLANSCSCVDFIPGAPQLVVGGGPGCGVGTDAVYGFAQKSFSFDYVFDDNSTQQELYTQCVLPLVLRFLDGFNATILAYGQTGSGKTYSMGIGLEGLSPTNALSGQGIVPRAISDLFNQISVLSRKSESYDAKVSVSFLELHNEELIDLLNTRPRTATGGPTIREDGHGNIVWLNLSEETVQSTAEILSILQRGSLCRTTGSTDMNATSSRSHAIFTVTLRQTNIPNNEGGTNGQSLISKFHFVDLAGSERLKRTNAEGDRKKEGISINQGLLALGNVISALGDESRKSGHVPYRDSKLTRMLQDSLGGNSQTLMLACISPSDLNYGETVNTLHYANRARNIKNKVAVNQDWGNAGSGDMYREVKSLRTIISQLRTEIALIRAGSHTDAPSAEPAFPFAHKEIEFRERRERDQNSEIEELKLKLAASTFQMERFQFHSFRLLERVQSQAQQILELTTERDTAIAEKCQILHTYASDPNALPHLDVNTSGKTAINSKEVWTTDLTDETPMVELPFKKKLKTSNGCSPVSSGTNTPETGKRSRSPVLADTPPTENKVISKMIREYQSTITNLQIQLAECEDKLAWQHEAMAKLGRNGGKSNFAWTENKLDEFNIPHNPMLKQIKIISSENLNNTNDVHREKEVMRALRENIELQEAISNLASGEETKLNIQSIMNEAFQDNTIKLGQANQQHEHDPDADPDVYLLINKIQNDIAQHEALVERIQKRDAEYEQMQTNYESKLTMLQEQMNRIINERDLALKKFPNTGSKQQNLAKSKFEEEKRKLDSQIADYRRKMGENSRLQSTNRNRSDMLSKELQNTINALKVEKMRILQDLRKQNQKHRDTTTANLREISKLKRREKAATDVAKRLERSNQLQRVMLKKKDELAMKTQTKLNNVMQLLKRSTTPNKIFKSHASGYSSPVPFKGKNRFNAPSMNQMLASVASPVRVSVSQSITKSKSNIEIHAQFKKQMVDKELASTITCRKTQKKLDKLQECRNRLVAEQRELIAERKRVIEAQFKQTGVYDDKSPQYMDERVQAIDVEVGMLDSDMKTLESTLKKNSGLLDGDLMDSQFENLGCIIDLSLENALNLLKSLDRIELEATLMLFMEDIVHLRTDEAELQEVIEEKSMIVENLSQQLDDLLMTLQDLKRRGDVGSGREANIEPSHDLGVERTKSPQESVMEVSDINDTSMNHVEDITVNHVDSVSTSHLNDTLAKPSILSRLNTRQQSGKPITDSAITLESSVTLIESLEQSFPDAAVVQPVSRIPSPVRRKESPFVQDDDAGLHRGRTSIPRVLSPLVVKDRSLSPLKDYGALQRFGDLTRSTAGLGPFKPKERESITSNSSSTQLSGTPVIEEEPKKKRHDLLSLGGSDVFKRLANSHTLASQAKVIHRAQPIDKESLLQDICGLDSKRKSSGDFDTMLDDGS